MSFTPYGNKLGSLQDSPAAIPVTIANQGYFERFSVVTTTVLGTGATPSGTITINLSIPADKGKIKKINKIAAGNSGVEYLQSNNYPHYLTAAVAGNDQLRFFLITLENGTQLITTEGDVRRI